MKLVYLNHSQSKFQPLSNNQWQGQDKVTICTTTAPDPTGSSKEPPEKKQTATSGKINLNLSVQSAHIRSLATKISSPMNWVAHQKKTGRGMGVVGTVM